MVMTCPKGGPVHTYISVKTNDYSRIGILYLDGRDYAFIGIIGVVEVVK